MSVRFEAKLATGPGLGVEWFALTDEDVAWFRSLGGLTIQNDGTVDYSGLDLLAMAMQSDAEAEREMRAAKLAAGRAEDAVRTSQAMRAMHAQLYPSPGQERVVAEFRRRAR